MPPWKRTLPAIPCFAGVETTLNLLFPSHVEILLTVRTLTDRLYEHPCSRWLGSIGDVGEEERLCARVVFKAVNPVTIVRFLTNVLLLST